MDKPNDKTNDGWREKKFTSAIDLKKKEHTVSGDMLPHSVNNKCRTQESVMIKRFGQISRKLNRLVL